LRSAEREVTVPLVYEPGEFAQVDFFEVWVELAGARQKAWLFLMRLMHSGRDFAMVCERQDASWFLAAHVAAFQHFGGLDAAVAYHNLSAAVAKIPVGAPRVLRPRFAATMPTTRSKLVFVDLVKVTTKPASRVAEDMCDGSIWSRFLAAKRSPRSVPLSKPGLTPSMRAIRFEARRGNESAPPCVTFPRCSTDARCAPCSFAITPRTPSAAPTTRFRADGAVTASISSSGPIR
jgi:hypothetical protein